MNTTLGNPSDTVVAYDVPPIRGILIPLRLFYGAARELGVLRQVATDPVAAKLFRAFIAATQYAARASVCDRAQNYQANGRRIDEAIVALVDHGIVITTWGDSWGNNRQGQIRRWQHADTTVGAISRDGLEAVYRYHFRLPPELNLTPRLMGLINEATSSSWASMRQIVGEIDGATDTASPHQRAVAQLSGRMGIRTFVDEPNRLTPQAAADKWAELLYDYSFAGMNNW